MTELLTVAKRIVRRSAPAVALAAAAALSLGAFSGYAKHLSSRTAPRHGFRLTLRTHTVRLAPGAQARLRIGIYRRHLRARINLRVTSKLPPGVFARLSPRHTRGRRVRLILRVGPQAAPGRYRVRIRGRAGRLRRAVTLTLIVGKPGAGQSRTGPAPAFSLRGDAAGLLEPGTSQPINVEVTNPNSSPLTIDGLTVAVTGVAAPHATASLPCTESDFAVQQYAGAAPLTVPASTTRSLAELGVPIADWPHVAIVDLPVDQDGCQGASLSLTYAADARLG
jgi:hypothetical protein